MGIVAAYSFLACGCPAGGVAAHAAACALTSTQWELVGRIEDRVRALCCAGAHVELAGGRAEILEELTRTLGNYEVDSGGPPDVNFQWSGPVVTITSQRVGDPVKLRCGKEGAVIIRYGKQPNPEK